MKNVTFSNSIFESILVGNLFQFNVASDGLYFSNCSFVNVSLTNTLISASFSKLILIDSLIENTYSAYDYLIRGFQNFNNIESLQTQNTSSGFISIQSSNITILNSQFQNNVESSSKLSFLNFPETLSSTSITIENSNFTNIASGYNGSVILFFLFINDNFNRFYML